MVWAPVLVTLVNGGGWVGPGGRGNVGKRCQTDWFVSAIGAVVRLLCLGIAQCGACGVHGARWACTSCRWAPLSTHMVPTGLGYHPRAAFSLPAPYIHVLLHLSISQSINFFLFESCFSSRLPICRWSTGWMGG